MRAKADALARELERLGTEFALHVAERFGVATGPAHFDHNEFGGVCAPFYARHIGHACPKGLADFDDQEWTTEGGIDLDPETGKEI